MRDRADPIRFLQGDAPWKLSRLLAAIAIAGVSASLAPTGTAAADRFTIDIAAGYSGVARAGGWMPTTVTVRNNNSDFRGTLQVTGETTNVGCGFGGAACIVGKGAIGPQLSTIAIGMRQQAAAGGGTPHRQAVYIPAGATKRFSDWVVAGGSAQVVLLDEHDQAVVTKVASLAVAQSADLFIGVVSDRAETLDVISSIPLSGLANPKVAHLLPTDLPTNGVLLRGFDALVFDGATTDSMTSEQKSALRDYVIGGGGLLLVAGTNARDLSGIPTELLPATTSETGTIDLAGIARLVHASSGPGKVQVTHLSGVAGSHVLADGGAPMIVRAKMGGGQVAMLAFDPATDPLASWSGEKSLLRSVLASVSTNPIASPVSNFGASFGNSGLASALGASPSLDLPSVPLVGLLLLLYVVLVGPVNYLVLRRMGRRHLAWLTVPAVVLVFSTIMYAQGLGTKGSSIVANRVNIVSVSPGQSRGAAISYTGIVAPHRGTYTVDLGGSPFASTLPDFGVSSTTIVEDSKPADVRLQGLNAYAIAGFTTEDYASLPGEGIATRLQETTSRITGTITNLTGLPLSDVATITPSGASLVGPVAAGGTTSLDVQWASPPSPNGAPQFFKGGPDVASQIYGSIISQQQSRERYLRASILRSIFNSGPLFRTQPILIGWLADNSKVVVGGEPATTRSTTLVIMPLTALGMATAGTEVPAGSISPVITEATGNLRSWGSQGVTLGPGGQVVYEMDMPGSNWRYVKVALGNAPVSGSCLGGGNGATLVPVPAPGGYSGGSSASGPGCGATPMIEAFNFANDTWTVVKPDNSAGQLSLSLDPHSGLVSRDGTVLLRCSTDSARGDAFVGNPQISANDTGSAA